MNLVNSSRRFAAVVGAITMLAVVQPAAAQEIADTHLAAARSAISAMHTTEEFDSILPSAAQGLKNELIQQNPNLQKEIGEVVDQMALQMAARRGDLERESALAYARVFSEEELQAIAGFFSSDTGQKLVKDGPIVAREVFRAADIWRRGITRDLAEQVAKELYSRVGEEVDVAPVDGVPVEGAEEGALEE